MFKTFVIIILFFIKNANICFSNTKDVNNINNEFGITPLMRAAEQNDAKATELFISNGFDINKKNIAGVSSLHIAAKNNSVNVAELLIKNNALVDIIDDEGFTPLMRACLSKNPEMVDFLLKNNSSLWQNNIFNESAIMHCCMSDCLKCLESIKNNGKIIKSNLKNSDILNTEFSKTIQIVYKKQNKEMEKIIDDIYAHLTGLNDEKYKEKKKKSLEELQKELSEIDNNEEKILKIQKENEERIEKLKEKNNKLAETMKKSGVGSNYVDEYNKILTEKEYNTLYKINKIYIFKGKRYEQIILDKKNDKIKNSEVKNGKN